MIPNLRAYADPLTNAMVEFYLLSQVGQKHVAIIIPRILIRMDPCNNVNPGFGKALEIRIPDPAVGVKINKILEIKNIYSKFLYYFMKLLQAFKKILFFIFVLMVPVKQRNTLQSTTISVCFFSLEMPALR